MATNTPVKPDQLSATAIADYIRQLFIKNKIIPANDKSFSKYFTNLGKNIPAEDMKNFDIVVEYINNTQSMKPLADKIAVKFKGIDMFRKNFPDLIPPSYAEYSSIINSMDKILGAYGAKGIAEHDPDFYANAIGNGIDAEEFQGRMDKAVDRVLNADTALQNELLKIYPGSSLEDIAHSMLLGKDQGVSYLEKKLDQAKIQSEFTRFGFQSSLGAEEWASLGISREDARKKIADIQTALPSLNKLSKIYEGDQSSDMSSELEKEAAMGMPSQRRKKLNELEKAQFSGTSGVGSTSLSKSRAGQL